MKEKIIKVLFILLLMCITGGAGFFIGCTSSKSLKTFDEEEPSYRLYLSTLDALIKIGKMDTILKDVLDTSKKTMDEDLRIKKEKLKMEKIKFCKKLIFNKKPIVKDTKEYKLFIECIRNSFKNN